MPTRRSAENKVRPPARPAPKRAAEKVGSSATYRSGPSCFLVGTLIAAVHDEDESADDQHGGCSGQPHDIGDDRAVFTGLRVVVVAVQQQLVYHVADIAVRSIDQCQPYVFGR